RAVAHEDGRVQGELAGLDGVLDLGDAREEAADHAEPFDVHPHEAPEPLALVVLDGVETMRVDGHARTNRGPRIAWLQKRRAPALSHALDARKMDSDARVRRELNYGGQAEGPRENTNPRPRRFGIHERRRARHALTGLLTSALAER